MLCHFLKYSVQPLIVQAIKNTKPTHSISPRKKPDNNIKYFIKIIFHIFITQLKSASQGLPMSYNSVTVALIWIIELLARFQIIILLIFRAFKLKYINSIPK